MKFTPVERDVTGIRFNRSIGQAAYIDQVGVLRFQGFREGRRNAAILIQEFQDGLLIPEGTEVELILAQAYQINDNQIFLRLLNTGRGRQIMFKINAPREVRVAREEFLNGG